MLEKGSICRPYIVSGQQKVPEKFSLTICAKNFPPYFSPGLPCLLPTPQTQAITHNLDCAEKSVYHIFYLHLYFLLFSHSDMVDCRHSSLNFIFSLLGHHTLSGFLEAFQCLNKTQVTFMQEKRVQSASQAPNLCKMIKMLL